MRGRHGGTGNASGSSGGANPGAENVDSGSEDVDVSTIVRERGAVIVNVSRANRACLLNGQ